MNHPNQGHSTAESVADAAKAHPIGTGVGAAGGAVTGAAAGSIGGPVGTAGGGGGGAGGAGRARERWGAGGQPSHDKSATTGVRCHGALLYRYLGRTTTI